MLYAQDNCLFDLQTKQSKTKQTQQNKNPNKQTGQLHFYIMFLSLHIHLWFIQFSWKTVHAVCLETEEKVHGNQNFFQQWFFVSQERQVCNESRNMVKKKKIKFN